MHQTIQVEDVNFHYDLFGHGDSTIVFISGYTSDIEQWRSVAESLKDTHRVLLLDNQGVGHTKDSGGVLSIPLMAENIYKLVMALGIQKAVFVGYAMGSTIVQQIAYQYPSVVSQLILCCSVLKWSPPAMKKLDALLLSRESGNKEQYCRELYNWCFGVAFKKQVSLSDFQAAILAAPETQTLTDQKRQAKTFREFDSTHWVSEIKAPVVVLSPKEDLFALLSDGIALAKATQGELVSLDCGHAMLLEMLDSFIEIFKHHLEQ